jgi:hypothetical protein
VRQLEGAQTACSAACRRRRSREREAAQRRARDRELVALLDQAEGLHHRTAEVLQMIRRRLDRLA